MKETICGAKTRSGTPCKRAPRYNGRCNLHGGKSLAWFAHPNFKHGLYSKYVPREIALRRYVQQRRDAEREQMEEGISDG
jgi:hypothetical protein